MCYVEPPNCGCKTCLAQQLVSAGFGHLLDPDEIEALAQKATNEAEARP